LLDREALKAARKTLWTPGKQRNIPVKCWMALPYNFTLK
jgi:outer membrane biosynthesis protein TonB